MWPWTTSRRVPAAIRGSDRVHRGRWISHLSGLGAWGRRAFAVRGARHRGSNRGGLPVRRPATLIDDQLDPPGAMTWRLHVFTPTMCQAHPESHGPGHGCGATDTTRARRRRPHLPRMRPLESARASAPRCQGSNPARRSGCSRCRLRGFARHAPIAGCWWTSTREAFRHQRSCDPCSERTPGRRDRGAFGRWSGSVPNSSGGTVTVAWCCPAVSGGVGRTPPWLWATTRRLPSAPRSRWSSRHRGWRTTTSATSESASTRNWPGPCAQSTDRRRPRHPASTRRTSRDARGGSGLRCNACAVVALGDEAIRPRRPAPGGHRATPWSPA